MELLAGPIYGTGLAIIAFVVLGNPSAGGPFPRSFMPPFWDHVGAWLPPGIGTDGIRGVVYDTGAMGPVVARLIGYIVIGALVCVAGTAMLVRRENFPPRCRSRTGPFVVGASSDTNREEPSCAT